MYIQDPPFCLQLELTQGCSMRCPFCAVTYVYPKNSYKYMTLDTAELIAERLKESGWNCRIEFAMHGEPMQNDNWDKIISIIRNKNLKLQIMMLTNGVEVVNKGLENIGTRFFKAGGNILGIELYNADYSEAILSDIDVYGLDECFTIRHYPADLKGNPHQRTHDKFITLISNIAETEHGTHSKLSNHAGMCGELDYSADKKPCVKPFREMGICYDGSVNICCNDFAAQCVIGNVKDKSLNEIWNSDILHAYRRMLLSEGHKLRPCHGCDYTGYRIGLLPDKLGKKVLDPFSPADEQLITQNLRPVKTANKTVNRRFEDAR